MELISQKLNQGLQALNQIEAPLRHRYVMKLRKDLFGQIEGLHMTKESSSYYFHQLMNIHCAETMIELVQEMNNHHSTKNFLTLEVKSHGISWEIIN